MSDRPHIGLDNPSFQGRLRSPNRPQSSARVPATRSFTTPNYASEGLSRGSVRRTAINEPEYQAQVAPAVSQKVEQPISYQVEEPVVQQAFTPAQIEPVAQTAPPATQFDMQYFEPSQVRKPQLLKRSKAQIALISMAVVVFLVGIFVSLITLQTNHSTKAQVAALAQKTYNNSDNNNSAVPSETKPSNNVPYTAPPSYPKFIKISKIGVDANIKVMGITSTNELKAPSNIFDVGWYNASAKPGDSGSNGAMLLDGHVHGPTLPGVFVDIKKLVPGDVIQIVRGDDKSFNYVVKKVQNYDANTFDMSVAMASIQPGIPGLNMITCGGPYDKTSGEYTQRTLVSAIQQ